MALRSKTRLGPYKIVSAIGAGGVGEVYRARDPRLKRDVAIKVLPRSFSAARQRDGRRGSGHLQPEFILQRRVQHFRLGAALIYKKGGCLVVMQHSLWNEGTGQVLNMNDDSDSHKNCGRTRDWPDNSLGSGTPLRVAIMH